MIRALSSAAQKYTFLLRELIARDFKVKYKRSALGMLWSLLYPVMMMAVMALVFQNVFRFTTAGVSYLSYLMTGLTLFNYFSEASNLAMSSVVANSALIRKVYMPKYIFPLSKCGFSTWANSSADIIIGWCGRWYVSGGSAGFYEGYTVLVRDITDIMDLSDPDHVRSVGDRKPDADRADEAQPALPVHCLCPHGHFVPRHAAAASVSCLFPVRRLVSARRRLCVPQAAGSVSLLSLTGVIR